MSLIAARTTSAFPVSIGTSLALESAFFSGGEPYDKTRVIPQVINLNKYQELWLNISTLFRNVHSSLSSQDAERVSFTDYATALWEEMEFIHKLVATDTQERLKVKFYVANYSHLKGIKDGSLLREQSTPKQIHYKFMHDHAIKAVLQHASKAQAFSGLDVKVFDRYVYPDAHPAVLIMTHMPYDLVKFSKFSKLELLESHTGIVKNRSGWYTKLGGQAMNPRIPFGERMLKTYGDAHMFRPQSFKVKEAVSETAKAKRWTWMTTDEKMRHDLKSIPDAEIREKVLGLSA